MWRKPLLGACVVAAATLGGARTASASLITYSDRASFEAAVGVLTTETFEDANVGAGTAIACPSPADSSSNNTCFDPGDIEEGITFLVPVNVDPATDLALTGAGLVGIDSNALFTNRAQVTLTILLASSNAIGFDLYSFGLASPIDILVVTFGNLATTFTVNAAANGAGTFFGVYSTTDNIFGVNLNSQTGGIEGVDNVEFVAAAVPEPTMLTLVGVGLVGLYTRRRIGA